MTGLLTLIYFGAIAFAIFEILLMFKLWGMCNDVKSILNTISKNSKTSEVEKNITSIPNGKNIVTRKSDGKQVEITYHEDDSENYLCKGPDGSVLNYKKNELNLQLRLVGLINYKGYERNLVSFSFINIPKTIFIIPLYNYYVNK